MNNKINELMEQAGVSTGQLFAEMLCADSDVNIKIAEAWNEQPNEVRQRIFQKVEEIQREFAVLIINECAGIALKSGHITNKSTQAQAEAERIYSKIIEHFGVE